MKRWIAVLMVAGFVAGGAAVLRPWHERRPWDRSRENPHYSQSFRWYGAPYYYFPEPYHLLQRDMCLETEHGLMCHYEDVSGKVYWRWQSGARLD